MKTLITLLLIIISFAEIHAQQFTMEDIPLAWNDFQRVDGNTSNLNGHAACIYSTYNYNTQFRNKNNKFSLIINFENYIDKGRSQVLSSFMDKAAINDKQVLLNHEKGHLIISIIHYKLLQQAWSSFTYTSNAIKEVDSISKAISEFTAAKNKNYDLETNHGTVIAKQKTWEQILLLQLSELYPNQRTIPGQFSVEADVPHLLNKINDPLSYNYNNKYSTAFEEHFDRIRNEWFDSKLTGLDTNNAIANVANGLLNINNTKGKKWWGINVYEPIDYSKNFEIELSFKIRQTIKKRFYALTLSWGLDSNNGSNANIRINASGDGKVVICHGGDHKNDKVKSFNSYPALSKDEFTRLTIRKVRDKYHVFINNRFEKEIQFESLSGTEIALGAFDQASVDYDYLKIFYLN